MNALLQLRKAFRKLIRGTNTVTVGATTTQAIKRETPGSRGVNTITAAVASAQAAKRGSTAF